MNTLLENSVVSRVNAGLAAGTGTTNTSEVSMIGFHSVAFAVNLSTVVAGGSATLSVQGRNDAGDAWADLEGSVSRDEAGILAIEISKPTFGEIRAVLLRSDQNVTTDAIMAIRSKSGQVPTEDAGQSVAVLVSPEAV